MSILKVARLGHPVLRRPAQPVSPRELRSPAIQRLIDDMIETMREYDGVGIAAPQVHEPLQIACLRVRDNPRYPRAPRIPLTVLVNPTITPLSSESDDDWEGCLSIPDLRGVVPRFGRIRVVALDRKGRRRAFIAGGFHARVIQHEYDHLQGRVYLDRMRDFVSLAYVTELMKKR